MAQARREEQFNRALTEHVHLGAGRHGPMVWRDNVPKRDGSAVAMTRCACGKSFTGHRDAERHRANGVFAQCAMARNAVCVGGVAPEPGGNWLFCLLNLTRVNLRAPTRLNLSRVSVGPRAHPATPDRTVRTRREPGPRFAASWTGSDRFGPGSRGTCPNLSGFGDVRT